jgi:phage gpG-like protein
MRDIGEIIVDHIKGNFRDSIAPDGTPWKPSRRVIREGGKTLIDTGVLRNSFHARAGRRSVLVGTPDERASTHQFGRGNIPARPFMPDPERFPRCLAEDIQESILDFLRIR